MRELPEVAMNETEIHANPVTLVLPNKSLQISLKKLISEAKKLVIKKYTTFDEALLAYYNHEVTLHERILVEVTKKINGCLLYTSNLVYTLFTWTAFCILNRLGLSCENAYVYIFFFSGKTDISAVFIIF